MKRYILLSLHITFETVKVDLISINHSLIDDIKIENSLATEFIFNGLSPPNTQFLIRLQTFNSIGMSNMSIETIEKTFESGS